MGAAAPSATEVADTPTVVIETADVIPYTDMPPAKSTIAASPAVTDTGSALDQALATAIVIKETAATTATVRMESAAPSATEVADTPTVVIETPPERATESKIATEIATSIPEETSVADLPAAADKSELATQARAAVAASRPAQPLTEPPAALVTSTALAGTATPLPEVIAHLIATPTAFGAVAADAEPACTLAAGWLPYEVQSGDSLLALALATGSSLIELREGNCFSPVTGIIAGESIAVPNLPESPIISASSQIPVADAAKQIKGCESRRALILEPEPMAEFFGLFAIRGRALIPDGGKYRLSVKPAWSPDYHRFLDVESPVYDDIIGLINTEIFGTGLQRLRLELVGSDGNIVADSFCEIPLIFRAHQTAMTAAPAHNSGRHSDE